MAPREGKINPFITKNFMIKTYKIRKLTGTEEELYDIEKAIKKVEAHYVTAEIEKRFIIKWVKNRKNDILVTVMGVHHDFVILMNQSLPLDYNVELYSVYEERGNLAITKFYELMNFVGRGEERRIR